MEVYDLTPGDFFSIIDTDDIIFELDEIVEDSVSVTIYVENDGYIEHIGCGYIDDDLIVYKRIFDENVIVP